MDILDAIRKNLQKRVPVTIDNSDQSFVHAAVLVPIFGDNGHYEVLLTERSHKVEHHKGQISFPGGSVEEQDGSLAETALRETFEEVGINAGDVEILGQLDDQLTTVSNFIVHPFVGRFPFPYHFSLNPDEVERIITVPLNLFLSEDSNCRKESLTFDTFTYKGPVFIYRDITVWGATALIMDRLIKILKESLSLPQCRE